MSINEALELAKKGFRHAACPDHWEDCNAARVLADAYASLRDPTPRMPLPWIESTELETVDGPPCLVGDRFLIVVPLSKGGYEYSVIVADERGWNDTDGESWSAWDWSSVSHYIPLDGLRTKEELEGLE